MWKLLEKDLKGISSRIYFIRSSNTFFKLSFINLLFPCFLTYFRRYLGLRDMLLLLLLHFVLLFYFVFKWVTKWLGPEDKLSGELPEWHTAMILAFESWEKKMRVHGHPHLKEFEASYDCMRRCCYASSLRKRTGLCPNLFLSEQDPITPKCWYFFCMDFLILAPAEWRNDGHINASRTQTREWLGCFCLKRCY